MDHVPQRKKDKLVAKVQKEMKQFYRRLMLLQGYSLLNYTGFQKILKKHDKVLGIRIKDKYMQHYVSGKPFHEYTELNELMAKTEVTLHILLFCPHPSSLQAFYAESFTLGNLEVASAELKARQHEWVDWNMLWLGIFSGMTIILFIFLFLLLSGTYF